MSKKEPCLTEGCKGDVESRGLCRKCYNQFNYVVRKMTPANREVAEAKAIEHGLILAPQAERLRGKPNPFNKIK